MLTRRRLLKISALAPLARFTPALADDLQFSHAISLFGDVKYPADFKNFDYVNPSAPKGGRFRQAVVGSFDSLNNYTVKGDPAGVGVLDTLMVGSMDEPFTRYGLIAQSIAFPDDKSRTVFKLNPAARFHDGKAITSDDVIFSLNTLKTNLPNYASYYKNVEKAEQTGEHEVTFFFSEKNNRELPLIITELPILPQHWWTSAGADGNPRNTDASSLEIPLGSGPYKIKSVVPGSTITLQRVADYWAKDLPVNVGQNNFDELLYSYYQTVLVAFEGFKGDQSDYNYETSSKNWATGYDFPAVASGKVVKATPALKNVHGMQAFVLNLRKAKFQDVRVRKAMILAYDFQWANTNLFFGQYQQSRSFFNGSEFEAKGLPSPE